jgi:hypothetical protein
MHGNAVRKRIQVSFFSGGLEKCGLLRIGKLVRPLWHRHLKPCALARLLTLTDPPLSHHPFEFPEKAMSGVEWQLAPAYFYILIYGLPVN